MKKIAPKFGQKIDYNCPNLNRLRLNVAAFAIRRDRSCLKCKAFLSQHHALMECKRFEDTRIQIESLLKKENMDMSQENILGIHKNAEIKNSVKKLIQQIDEVFII